MKIIFTLFLLFMPFSLHADDNLIPNGDMGDWPEGKPVPAGFELDATNGSGAFFSLAKEKHKGRNAIQCSYVNKGSGYSRFFDTPPVKLKPGEYELTFYVKGSGFLRSVNLCSTGIENGQRKSRRNPQPGQIIKTPMGAPSAIKPKDYETWREITVIYNGTKENDYTVSFANNNREGDPKRPLMIAGISLIKK
jgi:hypothetical protein